MAQIADLRYFESFNGFASYSATAVNGWKLSDTSSGGSPTVATVSGGGVAFTFSNTNEAQVLSLHHGDILSFPASKLIRVGFEFKVSSTTLTNQVMAIGMASATADDEDAITHSAWVKLDGSAPLVCETDDGVTDKNDIATGISALTTFKYCEIDFTNGLSDVRFMIQDSRSLKPVARTTTFDMSSATNLQPHIKWEKAASTDTHVLTVRNFLIDYKI